MPWRTSARRRPWTFGDWFRFEIGPPRPLVDTGGVRLPVKAFVGNTEWAAFHVDLVGEDLRMTGEPEDVPPLAHVVMPDVEQHGYRAYPLVDHVADKACAIFERHGTAGTPSLRCRDVVDLVAIVLAAPVEADPQLTALRSEAQRRGLQLPGRFAVPDRDSGNPATRPKQDGPSCRWRERWTRPLPRSRRSSIRSWTRRHVAGGIRRTPGGLHNTSHGRARSLRSCRDGRPARGGLVFELRADVGAQCHLGDLPDLRARQRVVVDRPVRQGSGKPVTDQVTATPASTVAVSLSRAANLERTSKPKISSMTSTPRPRACTMSRRQTNCEPALAPKAGSPTSRADTAGPTSGLKPRRGRDLVRARL